MIHNRGIKVTEIINDYIINNQYYTAYILDNGSSLYIKEITNEDIINNMTKNDKEYVKELLHYYESRPQLLNDILKAIYKDILMSLSDDFMIYSEAENITSIYKPIFTRNQYVNINHPITKGLLTVNKLIANLKNGYLTYKYSSAKNQLVGDHIDQNVYNNSFDNIRLVTQSENAKNKGNKYPFIKLFENGL